jgi:hypothetical protein
MRNLMALLAVTLIGTSLALAEDQPLIVEHNPHGTVAIVPPKPLMYSFEPMPPDRLPCDKITTTSVEKTPVIYSFARMPDDRAPVVACASPAAVIQSAALVPAPAPPMQPMAPAPIVRTVEPAPAPLPELPATATQLPLIGIAGLVSLGGAALARILRRQLS